jgi:hypothetical protein
MQGYTGAAEFDLMDRDKYDLKLPGQLPHVRFNSHIGTDELMPFPETHTLDHTRIHWELERWTLFTSLPRLMDFDKDMWDIIAKMQDGRVKVPDYIKDINPPTLWTYYSTLPSWARNDPIVRNVMMACEFHQPLMTIR